MIDHSTNVVVSMKHLAGGIVLLGAVLWAVLHFTIGGMRDDISAVRRVTETLQVSDKDSAVRVRETENRLIQELAGLRTDLVAFRGQFDMMGKNVSDLAKRLDDFQRIVMARQAALTDPKVTSEFVATLKKAGIDDQKLVVVPLNYQPFPPPK